MMSHYWLVMAVPAFSLLPFSYHLAFFPARPPTPPSAGSAEERSVLTLSWTEGASPQYYLYVMVAPAVCLFLIILPSSTHVPRPSPPSFTSEEERSASTSSTFLPFPSLVPVPVCVDSTSYSAPHLSAFSMLKTDQSSNTTSGQACSCRECSMNSGSLKIILFQVVHHFWL